MKTAVADTSIRAYRALTPDQLGRTSRLILDAMQDGKLYSRRELEKLTGLRSGSICGRVNKLIADGWLEVPGEKVCSESGEQVEALRLVARQMELLPA